MLGQGARRCRPDAERTGSDRAQLRRQSRRSAWTAAGLPAERSWRNRHLAAARSQPGSGLRGTLCRRRRQILRRRSNCYSEPGGCLNMTINAADAAVHNAASRRSIWSRAWENHAPGYLFLLPWLIGFIGLTVGPIISSFYLSFTNF